MFRNVFLMTLVLALLGCANPFVQYYQGTQDARSMPWYDASEAGIRVYSTDDSSRDRRALERKGYLAVGSSSFNGPSGQASDAQVREQAAKIGAQVVLVSSKYSHTLNSVVPLTLPNTSTSYSTGTATAFGTGGSVTAYGSGTTTTYGTTTTMVPVSVSRSDFGAIYFVKAKQRVGLMAEPLDDATRRKLGSNLGLRVTVVVEGTPAFFADILPGDVLLSVAGEPVYAWDAYAQGLAKYEGRAVPFKFNRDGTVFEKQLEVRGYR